MSGAFYYWDEAFRTPDGFSLEECLEKYGYGVQDVLTGARMELIYLDSARSAGNSWLLLQAHKEVYTHAVVRGTRAAGFRVDF